MYSRYYAIALAIRFKFNIMCIYIFHKDIDARNRSEISAREMYNQSTCSFYEKPAILLPIYFSDRDFGVISSVISTWTQGYIQRL